MLKASIFITVTSFVMTLIFYAMFDHQYQRFFTKKTSEFCNKPISNNTTLYTEKYKRETISIPSLNSSCEVLGAWLYSPTNVCIKFTHKLYSFINI
jgi:hypothetical protein